MKRCRRTLLAHKRPCLSVPDFFLFIAEPKQSVKPLADLQKAATGAVVAATIGASVLSWAPPPADATFAAFSSSQVVAEKVIREGVYGEYEVDIPDQKYDDARSTFKSAKETKTKKGEYLIKEMDDTSRNGCQDKVSLPLAYRSIYS